MTEQEADSRSWIEKIRELLIQEPQTKAQLLDLINQAEQHEVIDQDAKNMINGVIAVSEKQVRDVMIPRTQMISIPGNKTPKAILPIITGSGHSRFPVVSGKKNKIIGILLAKDLLKVIHDKSKEHTQIHRLIRPTVFVPECKPLDSLLKEFRQNRNHLAVVVDEYGESSGLITIEDVLEEIVGEIDDEYDTNVDRKFIIKQSDTTYKVKALTPVDEFNQFFSTALSTESADTIGGYVINTFNYVPSKGESIQIGSWLFTVVDANSRGILELKVSQ